ncbi:hypothetical protein COU88_03530 [Candidatus Roizmanbacteria bacterium CG10_big_fil_rev_8_21_14_0_10_39_6]|uniref:tRNA dimethylallyltransferase n=1 Tax=Candidatus Roizmanbacteria bacterium CG10_big_fil_rev_8_21_14_0_10_39_6 TaxID=1974853 RepID=A0A2M8KS13_9BACT|nr:MAG: hypothetical protein COU88_03530 [Candidatus Roizmanbacteria bacterium CG10_big_fil_rev_8_21_14_0_10_39_6]
MDTDSQPLLIITGQTATGKTKSALSLANTIGGEIVSADSRQSYTYLDIISGKDIAEDNFKQVTRVGNFTIGYYTVQNIRIWLYDVVDPKQYFSSYDWNMCAQKVLSILRKRKKIPIIVGGSYFYIKALIDGLTSTSAPNWQLRGELETMSVYDLQKKLHETQPAIYANMNSSDTYNKRRLIRKLEQTAITDQRTIVQPLKGYRTQWVGLMHSTTNALQKAIEVRVDERMKQGALDEMSLLMNMGYTMSDPGMQSIGYQQLASHISTDLSLNSALERWIMKERQYAKRQKTAMLKDTRVHIFSPQEMNHDALVGMLQ